MIYCATNTNYSLQNPSYFLYKIQRAEGPKKIRLVNLKLKYTWAYHQIVILYSKHSLIKITAASQGILSKNLYGISWCLSCEILYSELW